MATPTVAINKRRVLDKILAILIQPAYAAAARTHANPIGAANLKSARKRIWVCAGAPTGGTGVGVGDICLDTTGNNVYRYYDSAWDRIDITT